MKMLERLFWKKEKHENANINTAAQRLKSAGRVPFNIWGDLFLNGNQPQIRRVLVGQDAHECLLVFFYLGEILTLSEVLDNIKKLPGGFDNLTMPQKIIELKKLCNDHMSHLNIEIFGTFGPILLSLNECVIENVEFIELGSSFMSSAKKLDLCSFCLNKSLDLTKLHMSAIDHSEYFMRGAMIFNSKYKIKAISDFNQYKSEKTILFFHSRFVISYAVQSTEEFIQKIKGFSFISICDVFNLGSGDCTTSNNGLKQIFLDFKYLTQQLKEIGWEVYVSSVDPDFNSNRKCAVIKLFAVNKKILPKLDLGSLVNNCCLVSKIINLRNLNTICAEKLLAECNSSLSNIEWNFLKDYKSVFPIWGEPIVSYKDLGKFIRENSRYNSKINYKFNLSQLNYYIKELLKSS